MSGWLVDLSLSGRPQGVSRGRYSTRFVLVYESKISYCLDGGTGLKNCMTRSVLVMASHGYETLMEPSSPGKI